MDNTDMVITERINSSNSNMSSILPKTFLNKLKKLLKDKMNKEMILYLAIWNENINIVNNKLNEWSNMNNFTFDLDIALILSVLKNNKKIEALLLNKANEKLIEQKNKKWLVLHYLCSIKVYKEKIIDFLLEHKVNLNNRNSKGKLPLQIAVKYNNFPMVELLIKNNADIPKNQSDDEPFFISVCKTNNIEMVNYIINNVKTIDIYEKDEYDNNAFMIVCKYGYTEIAKKLYTYSYNINDEDIYGNTALIIACQNGHLDIIKLLVNENVNIDKINIQNKFYYCPLLTAVENNDEELVKILLQYNALINSYDTYGNNPLMLACTIGNKNIVELLLNNYSTLDINEKNSLNNTALHNACESGNIEIVSLLLDHHATINNINNSGLTELAIAGQNNHVEIVKLL
ncbi:ankyrin, partial [Neocallimastix californiae]